MADDYVQAPVPKRIPWWIQRKLPNPGKSFPKKHVPWDIGRRTGDMVNCQNCGVPVYKTKFWLKRHKRHFCSNACRLTFTRGLNHHDWKGGRYLMPSNGYIYIHNGGAGRREREHILIVEKSKGGKLRKGIVIHHINGDKTDNRKGNFLVCASSYHAYLEQRMAQLYATEHFGGT